MLLLLVLVGGLKYASSQGDTDSNLTLVFKWNVIDYEWPSTESRSQFISESKYVPQNCYIRDIKIWKTTTFVTVPRWKPGVPATLARLPPNSSISHTSPPLQPYPSWSMQTFEDCYSLQSAHTIDVDAQSQLWVLDSGVVEELVVNRTVCPPKLVIFDLQTNTVVKYVTIPPTVLWNSSVITTMALDSDRQRVYIADSNYFSSGFIVYDAATGTFERFTCEQLNPDDSSTNINRIPSHILLEFVSISLNTDHNRLYFSTADSSDLLYVNTSVFATTKADISDLVIDLGSNSRSSKLISDTKGYLYFNVIDEKSAAQWRESSGGFNYSSQVIVKSKLLCHWISSMDVDEDGFLWIASSRFYDYSNNRFTMEKDNMRIFRILVPRLEKPRRPRTDFNTEYVVLVLIIVIIGLIIVEIWMFSRE